MAGLVACPRRVSRRIGLAALLLLFGSENLQNAIADGDTRTISMHHMHTGEDITITFKRNGRYDDAALQKLNAFLRDWRREESAKMDPHLLDLMWEVYREVDGKKPIEIVCGYRSPQTNSMLRRRSRGVARFSQHTLGRAIDFYIPDVPLEDIRYAGLRMQRGGVGFYPASGSPFVHLDTGSVRHWPRMTHDQLARVFKNGKTVHVASDGRRLPGYQSALAEIERRGGTVSAAGDDRTQVAQRSKRGLIERLFGFGEDEDEAEAAPHTGAGRPAVAAARPEPAKPQLASAVPLPPIRPPRPSPPAKPAAKPAEAQYTLASVMPSPSPADIVKSRGMWNAEAPAEQPVRAAAAGDAVPPPAAGAIGSGGQRFVWLTGPQGRPLESAQTPEPPRPPAAIPETDVTASLGALLDGNDRVPTELALAYAAAPPRGADADLPRAGAVPSGAARIAPPAAAPRPATPPVAAAARPGLRADNPWLRSLIISPSMHYAMSVAALGEPDYRQLTRLMQKPASALALNFTTDPQAGMTSSTFSGPAVTFLPTIKFVTRTAGLN